MTFSCHFSQFLLSFSDLKCHPKISYEPMSHMSLYLCCLFQYLDLTDFKKYIYSSSWLQGGKFFLIYGEDIIWLLFHSQCFYISLYESKLITIYYGFPYQFLITTLQRILVKFVHVYTFIFLFLSSCEVLLFLSCFLPSSTFQ